MLPVTHIGVILCFWYQYTFFQNVGKKSVAAQRLFLIQRYISAFFLLCLWTRSKVCRFLAVLAHFSEQYILRPFAGKRFPHTLHRFAARCCKDAFSSGSLGSTLSRKYRHMAFPQYLLASDQFYNPGLGLNPKFNKDLGVIPLQCHHGRT